jgi:hypothetical protein
MVVDAFDLQASGRRLAERFAASTTRRDPSVATQSAQVPV